MNKNELSKAAKLLFDLRLNKSGLSNFPSEFLPDSIEEAYLIQEELKILYISLNNNKIIGKKVGCTNKHAQKQVNIFEPFYGNIFSKYSNISGCTLKKNNFYQPYIEPEISFRIKEDINTSLAPYTIKDSKILFDKMLPSIEIVDFRFGNDIKKIGIKNLISTNGASEYWIKSNDLFPIDYIDLYNHNVDLIIDNKIIDSGNTANVLKNPLNSAIWLINKLSSVGEPLLKGQYISTGSCTKAFNLTNKCLIKADFGILGIIKINYSE